MFDKFGLVSSTGGGSDSKNLSPVLAAERRGFVLVEMNQGCLECLKDSGPVVVPNRRKLPRVDIQFFHLEECSLRVERSKWEWDFVVTRMNSLESMVS